MKKLEQINPLIEDIGKIINLPKGPENLLKSLVSIRHKHSVDISPENRKMICDHLGIKDQTFFNYLTILSNKKMIRRGLRGSYDLIFLTKRQWKNIDEHRDIKISLDIRYSDESERKVLIFLEPV